MSARNSSKTEPATQTIKEFVEERNEARFAENQRLAGSNKTLRKALDDQRRENDALRARLAEFEHPDLFRVQRLFATKKTLTLKEIVDGLRVTHQEAERLMGEMAEAGYHVKGKVLSREGAASLAPIEHFRGDVVRFGVISDTHLGNMHAMEEELSEAYAVFAAEGITDVYAAGNLLDGEKTYRGQEYEIKVMGAERVVAYLAHLWPQVPGITTHHIASSTCHEGFYFKSAGLLIGKLIEQARPDMVYLGLDERDIIIHPGERQPILRIIHPGGGSSYAHSYRPQKIVESYSGGEKPDVLVIGHYHKMGYYEIRNVTVLQAGCMERQTPFMRKRSLEAMLGFWVVELRFSEHGSLRRVKPESFKYYVGRGGKILREEWE